MSKYDQLIQTARRLRAYIEENAENLTDEQALELPEAFPAWASGHYYTRDERVRYDNVLYKCVQTHDSLPDWTPPSVPALWTEVAAPGEIPEWKQPTGAQDAYAAGDKVRHAGSTWTSDVDANVWEPGVYGWTED